jgi:hypothetical protein
MSPFLGARAPGFARRQTDRATPLKPSRFKIAMAISLYTDAVIVTTSHDHGSPTNEAPARAPGEGCGLGLACLSSECVVLEEAAQ